MVNERVGVNQPSVDGEKKAGQQQTWKPEVYDKEMAFVSAFGAPLIDLLQVKPGETVIDWGCGSGDLASAIAEKGAHVAGIDFSASMIDSARAKYPTLKFEVADGQRFVAPEPVDAIFSNAALHWMTDAAGVAASMAASLKPGGRLVVEFGGHGNIQAVTDALREAFDAIGVSQPYQSPWYFPTIGEYGMVLQQAGFEVNSAILFDRPTKQANGDNGLRGWLATFADGILSVLPAEEADAVVRWAEERLRPALYSNGEWNVDYRRLRVTATRK
ncbi:methyltransferase domain-containing protein [Paenibacillus sp. PR3]|uniref:Methyltransferase domain-containing protein n=1 Tax=Paenibacillus terricola TaxID=2763503 RepID=A0ABR8MTR9_9BACL|nr:methyltransferase domain-containing protein [Paenibacillus terricola]MBD3917554.1 methyltransferase domain-containing protein [Paenibacillus terricola]